MRESTSIILRPALRACAFFGFATLVLLSPIALAFKPDVHKDITVRALSPAFVSYQPASGAPVGFDREVVGGIADDNIAEDYSLNFFRAPIHFDNERFAESSEGLITIRDQIVAKLTGEPTLENLRAARELLGEALHTVQDFYAHSTWVERNGAALAPLGRSEVSVIGAAPCRGNGTTLSSPTQLTSGFFDVLSTVEDEVQSGKCAHGEFPPQYSGINKDQSGRPSYVDANVAATRATSQYVNDVIQDLVDRRRPDAICALLGYADTPERCRPIDPPPPGSCQPVPPGDTCNVYRVDRFRANNATATRTRVWWDSNNPGGRPPDTVDPPRAVAVNEPITPVHICKAGTVWLPKQRTVSASTSRTNPPDTSCQVNTAGAAHAMNGPGLSVSCESDSSVTVRITEAGRLNVTRSFASRDEVPYAAEYAPYPCGGSNDTVKDGTVTWDLATGAGSIQDNLDIDIRIQLTWGYDYGCANITREAIAHDAISGNWDIAGDALPPAGVTFVRTIAAGQPLPLECTSAAD